MPLPQRPPAWIEAMQTILREEGQGWLEKRLVCRSATAGDAQLPTAKETGRSGDHMNDRQ